MRFAFLLTFLFSANLLANVATLKEVKHSHTEKGFVAEFAFDKSVNNSQATVDFINETVQINLSNAKIEKSKINTKVDAEKVKNIYSYNIDDKNARARIILNNGNKAADYQNRVMINTEGNKLFVTLDNTPAGAVNTVSDEDLAAATQWLEKSETLKQEVEEKKRVEALKESQIPVLTNTKAIAKNEGSTSAGRIVISLGIVLAIVGGVALFFKKIVRKTPLNKNSQIKILTQYYLGPRKSLAIVRVAGESILIGITDQNINMIKNLALLDEEIPVETPGDFGSSLNKELNKNAAMDDEVADEFSFSKVKDFVSGRLKNMKEL